jgi:Transposase
VIFVGVDWAEDHHDVCVMDAAGKVLGKRRIADGVDGLAELHELVGTHAEEPDEVAVGIEIDRGLIVTALLGAGYEVYAINPMAASRYRDRHATSGAKSDPGDAKVLADLVRTDRHNHRQISGDTELVEGVKIIARAHQNAIWGRQRQLNALRSSLREYYPGALAAFGTELWTSDAVSVLSVAPTPALGRQLSRSKIASALRRGGRSRNIEKRAEEIQAALRSDYLEAPRGEVGRWFGHTMSRRQALARRFLAHLGRDRGHLPSGPRSNRACRSPAHGFPTSFIAVHAQSYSAPSQ